MWPRTFHDRLTAPLPGLKALARFAREGAVRPGPDGLADMSRVPCEPGPLPRVDTRTLAVTWAGHASWIVRIGGLTVLTDPVWSRRILGTPARITPVGVPWEALPPVDAVVISHNHYDHLDAPTLCRLPRDTPVFAPAGLGRWFRRRRFTRVTELDWWEGAELSGTRFDFVPAHHWSKRTLTDTCRSLWGGWVLTAPDGQRLYFAGDTGYGHWFSRIGRRYPGIDLALMPIGAYDPAGGSATSTATPRRRSRPPWTSAPAAWPPCTGARSSSRRNRSWNRSPGYGPPGRRRGWSAKTCGTSRSALRGCWAEQRLRERPRAAPRALTRQPGPAARRRAPR
ncbi:MBL fold metallo-hydrolase [Streptomyces nogalater]